jgi:hypothetical protein
MIITRRRWSPAAVLPFSSGPSSSLRRRPRMPGCGSPTSTRAVFLRSASRSSSACSSWHYSPRQCSGRCERASAGAASTTASEPSRRERRPPTSAVARSRRDRTTLPNATSAATRENSHNRTTARHRSTRSSRSRQGRVDGSSPSSRGPNISQHLLRGRRTRRCSAGQLRASRTPSQPELISSTRVSTGAPKHLFRCS